MAESGEVERELERLHPASFSWALACCGGDRDEAEEVLQIVYLQVLDGRARFGGRSSVKTWLFAVIRRTAHGRGRRRRLRRALFERWARKERRPPRERPAAERRVARSEQAARLRVTLSQISRRQREVLELVFYHDLTVDEAARVMGVSAGTARVHYARGKKELARRLLEEEGA